MLYLINFADSDRVANYFGQRQSTNPSQVAELDGSESCGAIARRRVACACYAARDQLDKWREPCALLMQANGIRALRLYQGASPMWVAHIGLARNLIISVINLAKSAPFVTCSAPFELRGGAGRKVQLVR